MESIRQTLGSGAIIASVKDDAGLAAALRTPVSTIFLLHGDLSTVPALVRRIKRSGRTAFVNLDMIDGLAQRPAAIAYLKQHADVDGILTTKAGLCKAAQDAGLHAILRFFMVDSFAYHQLGDQIRASRAEAVEILPGCIPRVISWIRRERDIPIIAGGLVCDVLDVQAARRAGAVAVATSNRQLWDLTEVPETPVAHRLPPLTRSPGQH